MGDSAVNDGGNEAAVFEMMHSLLAQEGRDKKLERRNKERLPFTEEQLIAFCDGTTENISAVHFRLYECYDLSQTGFSFFCDAEPKQTHVVLTLGKIPFKFLLAKICHVEATNDDRWHLGCEFIKKIG